MCLAGGEHDLATGQGSGAVELVGRHQHGPILRCRGLQHGIEDTTTFGVEPGVGLVEQQQTRLTGARDREREP
ncbi:MAG: hypothetical protein WEA75_01390, partial [Acidimicrobiia bacterium]